MSPEQEALVAALRLAVVGDSVDHKKVDRHMAGLVEFGSGNPGEKGLGEMQLTERGRLVLDLATDLDRERLLTNALRAAVAAGAHFAAFQAALMSENADGIESARKKHFEAVAQFCKATDAYLTTGGGS